MRSLSLLVVHVAVTFHGQGVTLSLTNTGGMGTGFMIRSGGTRHRIRWSCSRTWIRRCQIQVPFLFLFLCLLLIVPSRSRSRKANHISLPRRRKRQVDKRGCGIKKQGVMHVMGKILCVRIDPIYMYIPYAYVCMYVCMIELIIK